MEIRRDSPKDVKFRPVLVTVDGKELEELQYKEGFEFEIEPGHHTISARNPMIAGPSIEFDAKAGEKIVFVTGNRVTKSFAIMALFLVWPPSVFLERV